MKKMFTRHDAGRALEADVRSRGDCVTRAVSQAARVPYRQVYEAIAEYSRMGRIQQSPASGINTDCHRFSFFMKEYGFVRVRLNQPITIDQMPTTGRHVAMMRRHASAVIDGRVVDTWDPRTKDGGRVYSYWTHDRSQAGGLSV